MLEHNARSGSPVNVRPLSSHTRISELESFSKKIDSKINEAKEATNLLKLEKEAVKKEVKELSMYESRLGKKVYLAYQK